MTNTIKSNFDLTQMCRPATIYFVISVIALIFVGLTNLEENQLLCIGMYDCYVGNTTAAFIFNALYILFWTFILDLMCKYGYSKLSWFILLLPFIIIIITFLGLMNQGLVEGYYNRSYGYRSPSYGYRSPSYYTPRRSIFSPRRSYDNRRYDDGRRRPNIIRSIGRFVRRITGRRRYKHGSCRRFNTRRERQACRREKRRLREEERRRRQTQRIYGTPSTYRAPATYGTSGGYSSGGGGGYSSGGGGGGGGVSAPIASGGLGYDPPIELERAKRNEIVERLRRMFKAV